MKLRNSVLLLAIIAGICFLSPGPARAQDTLTVQWFDGLNIIPDALFNAFTNDASPPPGRVYKLLRGGYYTNTQTINNTGRPLRIVGEAPIAVADSFPPLLQMYRVLGAAVPRMLSVNDDLVLKNLWITGSDDAGAQTSYQFIQVDGSGHKIVVDHCIFDRTNFAPIAFQGGSDNVVYWTNNHFRDLLEDPSTQKYAGRAVSIWANQDTVVFENNTIFMAGFCAFQMESGAIKYLRFNHNTVINTGRQPFVGSWWRTARFTNNLFINPFWHGEDVSDYTQSGRDPRAYNSGIFGIGPLPSVYGPEDGRSILFSNNAAYRDPLFATGSVYYSDSIRAQYFINQVTKEDFADKFPGAVRIQDTTWIARPNFTYPDSLVPKMWANIEDLRHGITPATKYFYALPTFDGVSYLPTYVNWPLPENFTYSTPANILTAGTDGLPLGDLNWFPTQKASFLSNYANNIKRIDDTLSPQPPSFTPVASLEAEDGTLTGSSSVSTFQGFSYFQMDGGGFFEWTFNVTTPGERDLRVYTHMRGSDTRGEHTYINTVEIHDSSFGYGELIWSTNAGPNTTNPNQGMPLNEWTWTHFNASDIKALERPALTLHAGSNTLRVSSSWGYQNFAEFQLVMGTDTIKLKAADATDYSIVTPKGEGAPWVPSHFKSVALGANGTVTWNINPASSGNYTVQLFYQNYGPTQAGVVKLDGGTVVPSLTFDTKADSTGLSKLAYPPAFPVTAGAHTISVSGSNVNLDFIQFTQVVTGVAERGGELPQAFELRQNYPNPFNPSTQIEFVLNQASDTRLIVYNILGQKVATLIDGRLTAGAHSVQFNARSLASGVYFYRLEAGANTSNKKMLLLK